MRMTSTTRLVLVAGLGLVLVASIAIGATTAAIYRGGTISVDVRADDGTDVAISVPAGLAEVALALVPTRILQRFADELGPLPAELSGVWPAVRSSYHELDRAEDFVLVHVRDGDETTLVQKRGSMLLIDVEGNDSECHVAVPLATLKSVLTKVERLLSAA
jgi:hypothetical protein